MDTSRTSMSGPEGSEIGTGEGDVVAQSPIDQILAGRFCVPRVLQRSAPATHNRADPRYRAVRAQRCEHTALARLRAGWRGQGQSLDGAVGRARTLARRARLGIQILRQRFTGPVPQTAASIWPVVLRIARNCSNRSRGEEQTNREELHILRRAGGIDRDHRPSPGSRKLARPRNVRAERDARVGGTRASIVPAGNFRKIPSNFAPAAVNSGGADGGVRYLGRESQS